MIWVWIALAVALTALLLKGKNIAPYNFIWALLPIDNYGPVIFGFTLKPMYIYSVIFVAFAALTKRYRLRLSKSAFISTVAYFALMFSVSLLRGSGFISDIRGYYAVFLVTVICAAAMMSFVEGPDDFRQVEEVLIATAVGFGTVFIVLTALYNLGLGLPDTIVDIYSERSGGILMTFTNMQNGKYVEAVRMRGFFINPNVASSTFIIGFAALLGRAVREERVHHLRNIVYSLVMLVNIILIATRSGLIVFMLIAVFYFNVFLFSGRNTSRKVWLLVASFVSIALLVLAVLNFDYLSDKLDAIIGQYTNRSGLHDRYGRFTIWSSALSVLMQDRNWLTGTGISQLQLYTSVNAHNTWLELACSFGIITGIYSILYFTCPAVNSIRLSAKQGARMSPITSVAVAYLFFILLQCTITDSASRYMTYMVFFLFAANGILRENSDAVPSPAL